MSRPTWVFSPLEFSVLWQAFDRDVLPYPLQYRSTEDTQDAYEQAWKTAAAAVHDRFDEDLYAALRLLVQPEARIEVAGFAAAAPTPPSGRGAPDRRVRAHAAISYQHAVLLTQQPTADADRGGQVRMELLNAAAVPARIAAGLPVCDRGTGTGIAVNRNDLDDDDRPLAAYSDASNRSPREQAGRFFNRPRTTVVHIAAHAGPDDETRAGFRDFHVLDYPEGRYIARTLRHELRVDPAGTTDIENLTQRILDATLRDYREENDPTYA
ncbi:ESX secretion-associated protein EspG [Nocardia cyriacigeorgica]|uniref:ESX secretion-associated protein EspG n=1 Tax=Nocardia cyriacigeorgica TaxID=135487 RepID=UPI001894A9EB|nr:ESX secretion-associated protein EspG [Nocardia cyriacigeorgica]MBF6083812.1 ESX secretion-associated protein EspG [Nocardia cyriacigeorgica]